MLKFDEDKHIYELRGKRLPSVTQLIDEYLGSDYTGIPAHIIQKAGIFGTTIHNAIEMYERIGILRDDLDEKQMKCLNDYLTLKENDVLSNKTTQIHGLERRVYYRMLYAGMMDMLVKTPQGYGIIDYKTSSSEYLEKWTLQLNLYKKAFEWLSGEKVIFLKVYHLKKRGKSKVIDIEFLEDEILRKVIHEF